MARHPYRHPPERAALPKPRNLLRKARRDGAIMFVGGLLLLPLGLVLTPFACAGLLVVASAGWLLFVGGRAAVAPTRHPAFQRFDLHEVRECLMAIEADLVSGTTLRLGWSRLWVGGDWALVDGPASLHLFRRDEVLRVWRIERARTFFSRAVLLRHAVGIDLEQGDPLELRASGRNLTATLNSLRELFPHAVFSGRRDAVAGELRERVADRHRRDDRTQTPDWAVPQVESSPLASPTLRYVLLGLAVVFGVVAALLLFL